MLGNILATTIVWQVDHREFFPAQSGNGFARGGWRRQWQENELVQITTASPSHCYKQYFL